MTQRGPSHIRDRHRATIARGEPPCWLCGGAIDYTLPHLDPMSYVVDHEVPLKLGGADSLANKRPAHRQCNAIKGAKQHAPIIKRSGALQTPGG